ncbi:MAG: hypothetical protein ACTSP9_11050 [Promethearchaeota archaeon]
MPDSNDNKLIVKLLSCSRCGNAFMIQKGQIPSQELVCDNCIKLEQRKKILSDSVIESQKETETNIKEFKSQLRSAKSQQIKQLYFDKIKEESDYLSKSIELLKKIEETNDEKYIEEYKKLFEKLKNL